MNTATAAPTAPRRIVGLTITCDHCAKLATHRSETKVAVGFDVHWTCADHTAN